MSENTSGSNKKRKVISATLAVTMAVTMLLSGTLAYYYSANAINTFSAGVKAIVGHDDFNEGKNKDVYVENIGETSVYVRVKLTEDLTMTEAGATTATSCGAPTSPLVHGTNDRTVDVNLGWKKAEHRTIHNYFTWTMGSATDQAVLSANDTLLEATEDSGNGIYLDEEKVAHDNYRTGAATGTEKLTAPACKVITMQEYNSYLYDQSTDGYQAGDPTKKDFVGWVYDNAGWYYWSQKLPAKTADHPNACTVTGFLLDNVQGKGLDNYNYAYHINVTYQAVDESDIELWTNNKKIDANGNHVGTLNQASKDAQALMAVAKCVEDGGTAMPKLLELEQNRAAAEADGSLGAAKLYEAAIAIESGNYNTGMVYTAAEFEHMAKTTWDAYNANPTTASEPLISLDGDTSTGTDTLSNVGDNGVARALVAQYGKDGVLTVDQAKAVYTLSLNKAEYNFSTLAGLTTTNFPSLKWLQIGTDATTIEDFSVTQDELDTLHQSDTDKPMSQQLNRLRIFSQPDLTSVAVANFTSLVSLELNNCTALTEISGMVDNQMLSLDFRGTAVSGDASGAYDLSKQTNLENLVINDKVKSLPNLSALTKLKSFSIKGNPATADGTSAITAIDLSGADDLLWLDIRNSSVDTLTLSPQAFHDCRKAVYADGTKLISNGGMCVRNSKLKCIDISNINTYTGLDISVSNSTNAEMEQSNPIPVVIRRADQPVFIDYPEADTYEKIIGGAANGTDPLYVLHKADGTTEETEDSTAFDAYLDRLSTPEP